VWNLPSWHASSGASALIPCGLPNRTPPVSKSCTTRLRALGRQLATPTGCFIVRASPEYEGQSAGCYTDRQGRPHPSDLTSRAHRRRGCGSCRAYVRTPRAARGSSRRLSGSRSGIPFARSLSKGPHTRAGAAADSLLCLRQPDAGPLRAIRLMDRECVRVP
jgi:hypothetical protein